MSFIDIWRRAVLVTALLLAACAQTPQATPAPAAAEPPPAARAAASGQPADVAAVYGLPDLDGRTVVAVTANDYIPLNYVDPLTGEAEGFEYDAVNEICRRLNCVVDWQVASWDTMISAV